MRASNARLSLLFHRLADRLEIAGGTPFQVHAYHRFADGVAMLAESLYDRWETGGALAELPGIGKAIAQKLDSLFRIGTFPLLEKLALEVPESQLELLRIRGLGPARVRALSEQIGVRDIDQLRLAMEDGRLDTVKGFGERTGSRIRRSLGEYLSHRGRRLRHLCDGPMDALIASLARCPSTVSVLPAGSYRRGIEDVGTLSLVVPTRHPEEIAACLEAQDFAQVVHEPPADVEVGAGSSHPAPVTVRLRFDTGLAAQVVACVPEAAGAVLAWFTGSKAHRERLARIAASRGTTFSPTGLHSPSGPADTPDEASFYGALGLPYVPPELREDRGELEAALNLRLPRLVERGDILGDLHMHTRASDGTGSVLDMALAARALGHRYIAVTDHTQNVRIANGLTPERAEALIDEVRRTDGQVEGIRLLAGLEVDILKDGSMDMPDELLARLDVVIASVHSHFDQPQEEMTARVLMAMSHPHVHILAHPTGRLIGQRSALQLDMDRVFEAAVSNRVCLELNSNPERLDLNDEHCRMAARLGIPVVISTDAHSPAQLDNMKRGVVQARRGWLEPGNVVNTRSCEDAMAVLRRRRG
jgi:DNA polymerase (family 10)